MRETRRKSRITPVVLVSALALGFALRFATVWTDPRPEFLSDSAYHLRMIGEVVEHGCLPARDRLSNAPQGRAVSLELPTGLYYAGAWLHRALAAVGARDLRSNTALFVALAGALIALPVFFAARAVFPGRVAAPAAALIAALLPAHLHRSYAFWLRYDALGSLLVSAHIAFLLMALAAPDRRGRWRAAALAALMLVAGAATWRVVLLVPFFELVFLLGWTLARGSTAEVRESLSLSLGLAALLFPTIPYLRAQGFSVTPEWLALNAAVAALWIPVNLPARSRWTRRALVMVLALGAGAAFGSLLPHPHPYATPLALVPAKLAQALGQRPALSPEVAIAFPVEEMSSASPLALLGPGYLSWLGIWFAAAPLLFWHRASGPARRRLEAMRAAPALLLTLCVAATLMTLLFARGKVLLAPLAAVVCGGIAAQLMERSRATQRPTAHASARSPARATAGERAKKDSGLRRVLLTWTFAVCLAVTAYHAVLLALSRHPDMDPALRSTLEFLRARTPADDVVMTPWEHGYEVQTFAQRAAVTDGLLESAENQRRIIALARAWMQPTPDSLARLGQRYGANWLLVAPSTHLYAVALIVNAPFLNKLIPGIPLTPAEADRVLVQMMVFGRSYPGFEMAFESGGYRVYHVSRP